MAFQSRDYPDRMLEFTIKVIDVLTGGDAIVPLPDFCHDFTRSFTHTISPDLSDQLQYIDFTDHNLSLALIAIIIPPLLWNIIGTIEYYTRIFSRLTIKPIISVYLLALFITCLSAVRGALIFQAIRSQPKLDEMDAPIVQALGGLILIFGLALLIGSYYRLGIVGTYLGDYFGFLQEDIITAFPFNVVNNPMYDGSSLFHLAEAIIERSPAGILLAAWLFCWYRLGCVFEEPFTAKIYRDRDLARQKARIAKLAENKTT